MNTVRQFIIHRAKSLCLGSVGVLLALGASAEDSPQKACAQGPEIVVSGSAEVSAPAAKANFTIEISTTAATAAAASGENAQLSRSVLDALHTANIRPEEVAGSHLTVGAQWNYDQPTRRQKRTAYAATNSIRIQTEQLDKVSTYIDVALTAGGTGVSEVAYSAKDPAGLRRQALSEAVAAARRDAEAIAQAGGGRLGDLELLSTEQSAAALEENMNRMFKRSVAPSTTEIITPQITESARILARWRFASGTSGK